MTGEAHRDVASYALGVLDDRDSTRFEEHLAGCDTCAAELESLLPVVELLGDVDGQDLATVEEYTPESPHFERVLAAVGEDRRRARSRRLYTLAAGIVLVAMLTGLGFLAGSRSAGPDITAQPPGTPADPWPSGRPGSPDGERFGTTDQTSGVHADFVVESRPFGTRVFFALSGISGPRVCRLVLLPESGPAEVISSWSVPPAGYGTAAQKQPLLLQAASATERTDIKGIRVEELDDRGEATPLVTVSL
ncbi:zf-HC2 domain-containing protein [Plantactinospora sp. B5E13]|uniref:zf-HC2 domain-containing protein n=1 Tax=unclassified Plantactinospora TaxID=2631981 RepID=UPI00325CCB03